MTLVELATSTYGVVCFLLMTLSLALVTKGKQVGIIIVHSRSTTMYMHVWCFSMD